MRKRSNLKLRLGRYIAAFTAISLLICTGAVYVELRLREVASSFAKTSLSAALGSAINRAAARVLSEFDIAYDDVAVLSRNEEGLVTSLEIKTNAINQFKSGMVKEVQNELSGYEKTTFRIPVSAAFGIYYSYLSYPKVSYTVSVSTMVFTEIHNEFTDAGINQVLHRISVRVGTKGQLAILGKKQSLSEAEEFTLAETVIVGAVPDAFTNIDYANEDIVDDVFDYGAEAPQ